MRTNSVRFDFTTFIAKGGCVFFGEEDGLADFFESSAVLFQELFPREAVHVPVHGRPQYSSGSKMVVWHLVASVMTHTLSPTLVL